LLFSSYPTVEFSTSHRHNQRIIIKILIIIYFSLLYLQISHPHKSQLTTRTSHSHKANHPLRAQFPVGNKTNFKIPCEIIPVKSVTTPKLFILKPATNWQFFQKSLTCRSTLQNPEFATCKRQDQFSNQLRSYIYILIMRPNSMQWGKQVYPLAPGQRHVNCEACQHGAIVG
jgi:hypothetical protein